ncbi:MAG: VIT domain-containing protein, partial [Candidatus Auribacterota bacterium]|nr:VIT domain-containing protein [Candidatus Auribacterota bacterium]
GDRVIEAKIEEKLRAQKIYQDAKDNGKTASLLQQDRPNVFQMKVANIMPGDKVRVEVKYTELLVPEEGEYQYVFPTVVGPRFTGEENPEEGTKNDNWTASPYLHEGKDAPYQFDINITLNAGLPITDFQVSTHRVKVTRPTPDKANISLTDSEKKGGNRDFILRYSLEGDSIQSGLLLYPGEEENFFLLMMEPPEKVTPEMIPPREYLFIVDVSGSMHGFPLDVSKTLINKLLGNLRSEDYFNILFFAGGSNVLSPAPLPVTEENRKKAIQMLLSQRGGGGTRILDALNKALALEKQEGLSRIIVMATDGYVSVEKKTFDLIRENLGESNFFAFGIGSSVNRYIIEGMARVGRGEPFVATNRKEAEETAERFTRYIESPLLTDIKVEFEGFDTYEVEPPALPDLFAARPLILYGKYKNPAGKITVTGQTVSGAYKREFPVTPKLEDKNNSALKYLWAREKIARLADYGRTGMAVKDEVTELGLKYHLMTEYTSFVAVDTVIRETGEVVTVKQPLPLPQGVSNYAVGGGNMLGYLRKCSAAPAQSLLVCEDVKGIGSREEEKSEPRIYVTGGTFPPGITLDRAEKILLDQIGDDLVKIAREWELKSLSFKLEVEKGKVTTVRIKSYQGKTCREEALKKLLKKLTFDATLTGSMELKINFGT